MPIFGCAQNVTTLLTLGNIGVTGFNTVYNTNTNTLNGTVSTGNITTGLIGTGAAPEQYVASHDTVLGRAGRLHVSRDKDGEIWIGGSSTTIIDGRVML